MNKGLMQSDLLDISESEQINAGLKKAETEQQNLEARKSLVLLHYDSPQNDNELLMNYQYQFLMNDDQTAWGKLIDLAFIVTKRLVWKWMKANKLKLDDIAQEERVSDAVFYVLRRYKTNVGYAVQKNYIHALELGVHHAMQYQTKLDEKTDLFADPNEAVGKHYSRELTDKERKELEKKKQKEEEKQRKAEKERMEFELQNPLLFEVSELIGER